MPRLAQSLSAIATQHRLVEKRLLVPNRRVGQQWLRQAARLGPPLVNFRPTPLKALAFELAGPALSREGWRLIPDRARVLVLEQLLKDHQRGGRARYLRETATGPGMAQTLAATIADLRWAGVQPEDLDAQAFEAAAKGEDLRDLLAAYEVFLIQRHWVDAADLLRVAVKRLVAEPEALGAETLFLVPEDLEATGLARSLIEQLPEARRWPMPVPQPGEVVPDEAVTNLVRLRFLDRPADAPPAPAGDATVEFNRALGEAYEIEAVFRRCLAEDRPLDTVEVLVTDSACYVPRLWETAHSVFPDVAEPPINFAMGLPVQLSHVGRALGGWLRWVRGGYRQAELLPLLREGLLRWNEVELSTSASAELARALAELPIGRDRERYLKVLDRKLEAAERQGMAGWNQAQELNRLADGLQRLMELLPEQPGPGDWLQGSAAFLQSHAAGRNELDNFSRDQLLQEIRDQELWLAEVGGLAEFDAPAWLAGLLESCHVLQQGPMPGKLHVSGFPDGGHSGRPVTWLLGLDEERVRASTRQDPLLLDSERRQIAPELPLAVEAGAAQQRRQQLLLARLGGWLIVSYSSTAAADGNERLPSTLFAAMFRTARGVHILDARQVAEQLPEPCGWQPTDSAAALSLQEYWLQWLGTSTPPNNGGALLEKYFPVRFQGERAEAARASAAFTEFDGWVAEAARDSAQSSTVPTYSAQALETLGRCPRSYFFERVLRLRPPPELADEGGWLPATERGRLLHRVFQRYHSERLARGEPPVAARDREPILSLLATTLEYVQRELPKPSAALAEAEIEELRWAVLLFLMEEERLAAESRPAFLEANIGLGTEESPTVLDVAEPLRLTLADGLEIYGMGRVDRLDLRVGSSTDYLVWDYKTGSSRRYEETAKDPLLGGRLIQPLLYVLMTSERLRQAVHPRARTVAAGYFFASERGHGQRIVWSAEVLLEHLPRLGNLLALPRLGLFSATEDPADCKFCPFQRICDLPRANKQAQMKLHTAEGGLLQDFWKVRYGPE